METSFSDKIISLELTKFTLLKTITRIIFETFYCKPFCGSFVQQWKPLVQCFQLYALGRLLWCVYMEWNVNSYVMLDTIMLDGSQDTEASEEKIGEVSS